MAQVTDTGIQRKTLAEYKAERETDFRDALGQDLNVDADTPQGQIIGIEANSLADADEAVNDTANSLNIFEATGLQLDGLFSLLAITRLPATKTLVTAEAAGIPATFIPAGTKARTTAGYTFLFRDDTTLDGSGNAFPVMISEDFGPVQVGVGELTQIIDVVPGWETINNIAAGVAGEDQESDEDYLRRYLASLSQNARSPLDSVLAAVLAVDTVEKAIVAENDKNAPLIIDGVSLDPHSLATVVVGGVDADIASAIQRNKTIGTGTNGTTVVTVPQAQGNGTDGPDIDIRFYRATEIRTVIAVTTTINNAKFPANGITTMKQNIVDYFAGGFPAGEGDNFETDGIQISEDVAKSRIYTPVNAVPGHVVTAIELKEFGGSDTDIITVNLDQIATIDIVDITVNGL